MHSSKMASQRRTRVNYNEEEIIDVIDLTNETCYYESQSNYNANENYRSLNNSRSIPPYSIRLQPETTALVSNVLDNLDTTISINTSRNTNRRANRDSARRQTVASNRNRTNAYNASIIEEPEELINLDDANPSKSNGPWCINDSCNVEPTILTCAICFDELTSTSKPMATNCGHVFCEKCLKIIISDRMKCPTCQSKIIKKSCIRLYF